MQQKRIALVTTLAMILGLAGTASARPRPGRSEDFESNKGFGLGVMLGSPAGLSFKYYLSRDRAIDGGLGVVRYYRHRDGVQAHIDYLFHPVTLIKTEPFWVPLYLGIGARVFDFDDTNDNGDDGIALGVRAPIGIMLDFNNVPVDVFFELALVADLLIDHNDRADVDLNGAIGVRYYFN